MKFEKLINMCDEQVNLCHRCAHKSTCIALQKNGIPKPYQYKGIPTASIRKKNVDDLLKQNRSL